MPNSSIPEYPAAVREGAVGYIALCCCPVICCHCAAIALIIVVLYCRLIRFHNACSRDSVSTFRRPQRTGILSRYRPISCGLPLPTGLARFPPRPTAHRHGLHAHVNAAWMAVYVSSRWACLSAYVASSASEIGARMEDFGTRAADSSVGGIQTRISKSSCSLRDSNRRIFS